MNIDQSPFKNAIAVCNGCGEAMMDMGIWPVQFPRTDKVANIQITHRFTCKTCRIPHKEFKQGIPSGVAFVIGGE